MRAHLSSRTDSYPSPQCLLLTCPVGEDERVVVAEALIVITRAMLFSAHLMTQMNGFSCQKATVALTRTGAGTGKGEN